MSKTYRNFWVFGDSYSTPGIGVNPADSFWGMTADYLQVEKVYNYSWTRNTLDSVSHTLISESDQFDWDNDFFLIGIPPLVRLTVVSDDDTKSYHRIVFDKHMKEIDQQMILCHHGLECRSFYNDPLAVRFDDPTWTEVQACRTIFLLNRWLDACNANYLIINLSKDFMTDFPATGKFLLEKCFSHPRNILTGKTYYGINLGINQPGDFKEYGWSGHHDAVGNGHFFKNSLKPKIEECGLI